MARKRPVTMGKGSQKANGGRILLGDSGDDRAQIVEKLKSEFDIGHEPSHSPVVPVHGPQEDERREGGGVGRSEPGSRSYWRPCAVAEPITDYEGGLMIFATCGRGRWAGGREGNRGPDYRAPA